MYPNAKDDFVHCKFVLIERYTPPFISWEWLEERNNIESLSAKEVFNKYQGFEGELIASFSVSENTSDLKEIMSLCIESHNAYNYLFLCLISNNKKIPRSLISQFVNLGYEYGTCEDECTVYSSVSNEILFGIEEELVKYKDLLNDQLLFPNRDLVDGYAHLHHELLIQGKNVEWEEYMEIYEVWKYADAT